MKSMFRIFAVGIMLASGAAFSGEIEITGCVESCTAIPEVSRLDYPNCLYTAELDVYRMTGGESPVPDRVVLTIPIVLDKKMIAENKLAPGDKICVKAIRYDDTPQKIQEMQIADDLNLLEYENYFSAKILHVDKLPSRSERKKFIKKESTLILPKHPRHSEFAKKQRADAIKTDLCVLNELFATHGGDLESWERELKPVWSSFRFNATGTIKTQWIDRKAYAHLTEDIASKRYFTTDKNYGKSAVDALIKINHFLQSLNIDFLVVPFPDGYDLSIEKCCDIKTQDGYVKPKDLAFIKTLLENNVETINLLPALLQAQKEHPMIYSYPDYHPNAIAYSLAAKIIAERLTRYNWQKNLQYPAVKKGVVTKNYFSEDKTLIAKDFFPTVSHVEPSNENPKFVLIGDSFENGIKNYLFGEIQQNCNLYYRNGGAYQLLRYLSANDNGLQTLTSAPVVIFVFDASHIRLPWVKIPASINTKRKTRELSPDCVELDNISIDERGQYIIKIPAGFEGKVKARLLMTNTIGAKGFRFITGKNDFNSEFTVLSPINKRRIYVTEIRAGNDQIDFDIPRNCDSVEVHIAVRVISAKNQDRFYVFDPVCATIE